MALDQFGNYVCDLEPPVAPYPTSSRCCNTGEGAPNDADGADGQTYVDTLNTRLYYKAGGTWHLAGSGSSGLENISGNGSPVGVVTPDGTNQIYRDNTTDNYWWATGPTNADWTPFV